MTVCSHCLFWKRRTETRGMCWLPENVELYPADSTQRHESDTCPKWTQKVVMVPLPMRSA
jgi:hypothetical protein